MSSQSSLVIRISADATQATSAIQGATQAVNNLGVAGNAANSGIASLSGGVQNLGRWSGQTTSAIASMTGGISGLSSQSNAATSSIQRLNQSLTENERASNAAAGSMRSLNSVLGAFGVVTGIVGLAQLAKNILQINIEMEALRARLDMTMPSLAAANNAFSLILKIAKETPQSIDEITKAFLLLRNSGLDASEKSMRGWTDVASKFGGTADMLTGVIRQYGQAQMKGALHAQDANAMIERGVPLYGLLTEVTGKSAGQIIKMMEAGELNNKTMDKALELLFKMSSGSSAKAMETMRGQIEGLGSAWSGFVDVLMGDKSEGMIKNMLGLLSATLEHFTKLMGNSIDVQIREIEKSIAAHRNQGTAGNFVSGLLGVYDEKAELAKIESLKAAKQKGIDDIAFMEKDALVKKQAQEIQAQNETNKAIERGDSDAIKKLMSGKLEKMKDYQSKMIEIEAQKYNVPADLPKALAAVESTFDNTQISPMGAAGLFQIMPDNLKARGTSTREILADEKKSVEVGMKMIADVWEKSGYNLQKFWTLWNAGHLRLTKEGVFSMALQPKETQKGMPQLVEAYKQLGGEVSDLTKLEQGHTHALKEAATEQKHIADESAQAAKKAADEHEKLIEKFNDKDPFKDYFKSMAELNSVQKDLSPETFLLNQQKIATEFEKNTVDLKAYNDELERHKKYLEHVGDYNSIVAESKNNLTRGAITPQEHGLNVANANAGLMNNVADAYPNAKIPKIPVNQATEVIDKKNINESSKELAKFNDQTDKAIEKLNQFGDSGKMAFDGLLGGISAVASAASSFGDAMSKLNTDHAAYAENYNKFMADSTKSESDKAEATKGFAKEKEAYDTKSFQTEINGAMSVAGAAAKMFNQKSVAARAFHGVEMGLAVISMAMSAKKMVVDIAAGAAAMFGQSGWAGFAGVAAMGAVMAGLGVAMTGGSKTSGAIQESTKTTGTVLGDSNKQSESISNITKTLNDISDKQYPELKNITSAVKDLGTAQSSMLINMFRGGGVKLGTVDSTSKLSNEAKTAQTALMIAGAVIAPLRALDAFVLSKIPVIGDLLKGISNFIMGGLFGKVTQSVVGGGVRINEQTLGSVMDLGVIDGNVVTTIETKKSSWFKTTRKISEVLSALDDSIASGMGKIFSSMGKATLAYWDYLGLNLTQGIAKLSAYNIPAAFIKTFGLKDDEIQKAFDNYSSMSFDKMIEYMLGGFTKQFQQMGETLTETMNRLMVDATSVKYAFRNAGLETGLTGENLVIFSQQMIDAAGGLKNLTASLDVIANKLTPKSVKTDNAKEDLTKILADTDFIANAKTTSVDTSGFTNVLNNLSKGASLSQAELDKLKTDSLAVIEYAKTAATAASVSTNQFATTKVSNAADMAFSPKANVSKNLSDLRGGWESVSGGDWSNKTWENINAAETRDNFKGTDWANYIKDRVGKGNWAFDEMSKVLTANSATSAQGHADLTATVGNFSTKKEFDAAKAQAEAAAQPSINLSAATVTAANSIITLIDSMADKSKETQSIQESILKQITSSTETTQRARDIVIAGLDDSEKITGLDSRITTAFAKWAHEHQVAGKDLELTTANLQRFNDALLDTKKLSDAAKYMTDFSTSISGWVNNQKVTQLGSTQTQLVNAGKAFDALMLRINLPNSVEDKKLAMSSITQSADAYMNSIKNFYGSSKAGQDLMQGVIDQVSVLPDSVNIQQMIYDKLEDIRLGIVTSPTFSGTLTPENKTIMDSLVTTTKALVDKMNTAPTLQTAQELTTNAKVLLTLGNISAATDSSDGVFLNKLITSIGSNTGLLATIDATVNSKLDPITKQSAIDSLTNSLSAIQVSITKFKANPTPEGLASLQNDIKMYGDLTANVNAKVTALSLNPNDSKLKADVQTSLDSMNAFSAKIGGLALSTEAIAAANAQIAANVKPEVVATVTFKDANDTSKAYLQGIKDVTETAAKGLEIKINAKVDGTSLNTLNDQTTAVITNMTKLGTEITAVATKLGDKAMSTVMASTSGGVAAFDTSKLVAPVSLRENLENSGAISYFDSSLTESQLAAGERIGGKLTSVQVSNYTKAMALIFKKGSAFNKDLSFVDAYNQSHPDKSISMDLIYTVLDDASLKSGGIVTADTLPKTATVAQKAAAEKADYDTALAKYNDAVSIMNKHKSMYASTIGFNATHPNSQAFATGGAFTNGIVDRPTSFNMGLMGESGSEAIMPLHNIGGALGVRAILPVAANDSGNNEEEIAELKAQNQLLNEQNAILREGFLQLIAENKSQNKSLNSIKVSSKERAFK